MFLVCNCYSRREKNSPSKLTWINVLCISSVIHHSEDWVEVRIRDDTARFLYGDEATKFVNTLKAEVRTRAVCERP